MFENFVLTKIESENIILKKLIESIPSGENLTRKHIQGSTLSDFTKNYLIFEFNEKTDPEELASKIAKSNKLYFNYAIRPKWTLETFLFNNFESRPPIEILKKLDLFTFYSFYVEAVKDFINDNAPIFITRNEVTSIIDHTNGAIYDKLLNEISNAKIRNFFLQIFLLKYETESNFNLESTIPYSFIKIFLEDKSFPELEKKFSTVKSITGETELSLKDIIKILTGKFDSPEKTPIVKEESEPEKIIAAQIVKKELKPEKINVTPEVKDDTEKIEISKQVFDDDEIVISEVQKFEINNNDQNKKSIEVSGINGADIIEENYDAGKILNSVQKVHTDSELEEPGKDDNVESQLPVSDDKLKSLFSQRQLEKILNRVYRSDLIYREKSFDKLREYKTWSEASSHLKNIFKINNVDLYNKDVVTFVNILNEYYQDKE